jgi:uncharacterized protein YkwD
VSAHRNENSMWQAGAVRRAVLLLSLSVIPIAFYADSSIEACFRSKVNAERTSRGLAALKMDSRIDRIARDWAAKMAAQGEISHNPNLENELPPFEYGGEDVGMGPTCDEIHQAFMNSSSHKAVMLDSDYKYLGVGVTLDNSTVFVVLDFFTPRYSKPAPKKTVQPTPKKTSCV